MRDVALVVHWHFYQPPRENPWTEMVAAEASAAPGRPATVGRVPRRRIGRGLLFFEGSGEAVNEGLGEVAEEGALTTLDNTVVRDWSWPCVMVFVDAWVTDYKFEHPDQAIPRALYLPDGRVVPTCVLQMNLSEVPLAAPLDYRFPRNFVGGGYTVLSEVQSTQHLGSVGCLVTDGNMVYAMTNRHVTGEPCH